MDDVHADLYEFIDIEEDGNKTSKQYYFTPDINQFLKNNPTLCLAQIKDILNDPVLSNNPFYMVISHGTKTHADNESATGFFITKNLVHYASAKKYYDKNDLEEFIIILSDSTIRKLSCKDPEVINKMIAKMNPGNIISSPTISIQVISSKSEAAHPKSKQTRKSQPKLSTIPEEGGESGGNRKSKPRKKNTTKRKRKTKRNRYSASAI
jgi:hypothetical protein